MTEIGTILHLQRLSTEDGPGIRTTIFMKGCTLRCAWCHNPESFSPQVQVQRMAERGTLYITQHCFHCGASEERGVLMPVRTKGQSLWVCTHCLPALIHG